MFDEFVDSLVVFLFFFYEFFDEFVTDGRLLRQHLLHTRQQRRHGVAYDTAYVFAADSVTCIRALHIGSHIHAVIAAHHTHKHSFHILFALTVFFVAAAILFFSASFVLAAAIVLIISAAVFAVVQTSLLGFFEVVLRLMESALGNEHKYEAHHCQAYRHAHDHQPYVGRQTKQARSRRIHRIVVLIRLLARSLALALIACHLRKEGYGEYQAKSRDDLFPIIFEEICHLGEIYRTSAVASRGRIVAADVSASRRWISIASRVVGIVVRRVGVYVGIIGVTRVVRVVQSSCYVRRRKAERIVIGIILRAVIVCNRELYIVLILCLYRRLYLIYRIGN